MLCGKVKPVIGVNAEDNYHKLLYLSPYYAHIVQTLQWLCFKALQHPPYSTDLAPPDHCLEPLKMLYEVVVLPETMS